METVSGEGQSAVTSTPDATQAAPQTPQISEGQSVVAPVEGQAQTPAEVEGLKAALQAERAKAEAIERERDFYRQIGLMNQQPQKPAEPAYDPTDYPTYGAVEQVVGQKLSAIEQQIKQQAMFQSEMVAKQKYSDWEHVVNTYTKEMIGGDPAIWAMIERSPNPAETAYNFGRSHPGYVNELLAKRSQEVAKTINGNLNQTPTLSNAGVSGGTPNDGYWNTASVNDLEAKIAEVKRRQ